MRYIDCRGEHPTLNAMMFIVKIDHVIETLIWVSMGLEGVELIISGRYQGKKIATLFEYK